MGRERIPVALGRVRATISAPASLAPELRSTFRDLLRPADDSDAVTVSVRRSPGGHRVSAGRYRTPRHRDDTAVDQVVSLLLRISLEQEAGRLHLHAGYVAWSGRGVLIAGTDGSGKSTLVAKLVLRGFDYFTEELVGFDRAQNVSSFPKPLSLTAGSFSVLAEVDPARTGVGSASAKVWHVPATALRPGCLGTQAQPAALVFVRYVASARVEIEDLHPAEAARRLLADSPDPPATGADGMRRAADLCAGLRCVELTYGDDERAILAVRTLAEANATTPLLVRTLPVTPSTVGVGSDSVVDRDSVLSLAPQVTVVVVGERALAWHPAGPQIVELDEPTSVWLQMLDGRTSLGELVDEVAAANQVSPEDLIGSVRSIVAELARIGVVAPAS
jgi:hypothetical protein